MAIANKILSEDLKRANVDIKYLFLLSIENDFNQYSKYCKTLNDKFDRFEKSKPATKYLTLYQQIYVDKERFEQEAKRLRQILM